MHSHVPSSSQSLKPRAHWHAPIRHSIDGPHGVPSGAWSPEKHPPAGLHPSTVHGSSSIKQLTGPIPAHVPPPHTSPLVHGSPSSHGPSSRGGYEHPVARWQVSSVHGLPSAEHPTKPVT